MRGIWGRKWNWNRGKRERRTTSGRRPAGGSSSVLTIYNLWAQCGWQERQRVSLMLAIARVPVGVGSFTGCICQIIFAGRPIRLATYQGARVEEWSPAGARVRQGRWRLAVDALAQEGRPLQAPEAGGMSRTIHESLYAALRLRLWEGESLLFDYTGGEGSFEYAK